MAKIESTLPSDTAADPQHPQHARWVKATLIEDECSRLRAMGIAPDTSRIDREWTEACERVDRKAAETPVRRKAAQPDRRKRADQLASQLGYMVAAEKRVESFQAAQRCRLGCGGACRRCRLESRIRALCASEGAGRNRRFLFPEGKEVIQHLGHCLMRRGLYANARTEHERNRILDRELERLADRSVPRLGGWR